MANSIKLTAPFTQKPSQEKWALLKANKDLMADHMDAMCTQATKGFPRGPYPYFLRGYGWVQAYFTEQEGQHLLARRVYAATEKKTFGNMYDVKNLEPQVVPDLKVEVKMDFEDNQPVLLKTFQEAPLAPGETEVQLVDCGPVKLKYIDFKEMVMKESENWPKYHKALQNYHSTKIAAAALSSLKKRPQQKRKYHEVCALIFIMCPAVAIVCALINLLFVPCLCPD